MLRRALDVVRLVALRDELSVREIGDAMGLPKSTAHRLVTSLVEVRLLQPHRRPEGDVYSVGGFISELGGGRLHWPSLIQHARPEMTAMRDELGETVGLHVLYAGRRVLLAQVESRHQHRWVYDNLMVPRPLYAGAAAKMLLAMLDEAEMAELLKQGAEPGEKPKRARAGELLLQDLKDIRKQRFSLSADEVNPGIASLAVPVIADSADGLPLSVISLAGPSVRLTEKALRKSLPRMTAGARAVEAQMREATFGLTPQQPRLDVSPAGRARSPAKSRAR